MQQEELEVIQANLWHHLWKLNIPPKMKNFMWRTLNGVLPTANKLRQWMVQLDLMYPMCSQGRKSAYHILLNCDLVIDCWRDTSLPYPITFGSISSWLDCIFRFSSKDQACMAVMFCWELWLNRNYVVWKNQWWASNQIRHIASSLASQWNEAREKRIQIINSPFPV